MDDREIILALAICDLLGKPATSQAAAKAFENAEREFARLGRPPKQAIVSRADRRDETEQERGD
jgi:hypothetical protein